MNERGIEVFLAITMARNFRKAAEILNLSQSTVSHHLKELEEEMGAPLIERYKGRKNVTLTNFGEKFLPLAFRWQEIRDEMDLAKNRSFGCSLSIGGLDSVKNHVLLPFFRKLLMHKPQVQFKLFTGSSTNLYECVAKREIDVAFVQLELQSTYVRTDPFYEEKLLLIRECNETADDDDIIETESLNPQRELQIDWGYDFRRWHDNMFGPTHPAAIICDTLAEIKGLLSGELWSIVPESSIPWFQRMGNYRVHELDQAPPIRVISKITHREPRVGAEKALKIFTNILKHPPEGQLPPGLRFL